MVAGREKVCVCELCAGAGAVSCQFPVSGKSGEMSVEDFEIRAARLDEKDIEAIVHQRRAMFSTAPLADVCCCVPPATQLTLGRVACSEFLFESIFNSVQLDCQVEQCHFNVPSPSCAHAGTSAGTPDASHVMLLAKAMHF